MAEKRPGPADRFSAALTLTLERLRLCQTPPAPSACTETCPAEAGNTVPLSPPCPAVTEMTVNAASVVGSPNAFCSAVPVTVVVPPVPSTDARRMRGDTPWAVTVMPIRLPRTIAPRRDCAAARLSCRVHR